MPNTKPPKTTKSTILQQPVRVPLPIDIDALIMKGVDVAIAAKLELRSALTNAFAQGFKIVGFDTKNSSYLLDRP